MGTHGSYEGWHSPPAPARAVVEVPARAVVEVRARVVARSCSSPPKVSAGCVGGSRRGRNPTAGHGQRHRPAHATAGQPRPVAPPRRARPRGVRLRPDRPRHAGQALAPPATARLSCLPPLPHPGGWQVAETVARPPEVPLRIWGLLVGRGGGQPPSYSANASRIRRIGLSGERPVVGESAEAPTRLSSSAQQQRAHEESERLIAEVRAWQGARRASDAG